VHQGIIEVFIEVLKTDNIDAIFFAIKGLGNIAIDYGEY
jgi:hypothetical protein